MTEQPEAADELREAIDHVDRFRRLSDTRTGGYADMKLAGAASNVEEVLDKRHGTAEVDA